MAKVANLPAWTDDCRVSVQEIDAQHRTEHERFARKVGYFRRGLAIGKSCVANEVLDFLTHWLVHHIQDVDRRYSDCFRAHGLS